MHSFCRFSRHCSTSFQFLAGANRALRKPSPLVGQAAEFKFESKFETLLIIWQVMWQPLRKDCLTRQLKISNANLKINHDGWALGAAPRAPWHSLGVVGRASTNRGLFWLGGNRFGLRPARLRKNLKVLSLLRHWLQFESKRDLNASRLCKFKGLTMEFLHWKWIFDGFHENLSQAKSSDHCLAQSINHSFVKINS